MYWAICADGSAAAGAGARVCEPPAEAARGDAGLDCAQTGAAELRRSAVGEELWTDGRVPAVEAGRPDAGVRAGTAAARSRAADMPRDERGGAPWRGQHEPVSGGGVFGDGEAGAAGIRRGDRRAAEHARRRERCRRCLRPHRRRWWTVGTTGRRACWRCAEAMWGRQRWPRRLWTRQLRRGCGASANGSAGFRCSDPFCRLAGREWSHYTRFGW